LLYLKHLGSFVSSKIHVFFVYVDKLLNYILNPEIKWDYFRPDKDVELLKAPVSQSKKPHRSQRYCNAAHLHIFYERIDLLKLKTS
jgi:hypothetical protein